MLSFPIEDKDQLLEVDIVFRKVDPQIIAHETLHAYSAHDLYDVMGTPEGNKAQEKAREWYPKEIMLTTSYPLEESEFSEYTAFLVGWDVEPEDWFEEICQPYNKKGLKFAMDNYENYDENGNLVVNSEEADVAFEEDEAEFTRYIVNENENLVLWKKYDYETEEEIEFQEDRQDDNFYYIQNAETKTYITVPKKGGSSFVWVNDTKKWEVRCSMSPKEIEE